MESGGAQFYSGCEEHHQYKSHFLEACFLCRRPLSHNIDIFMYRGNTPFCSQECRQEQIEKDEAKERRFKLSSSSSTTSSSSSKRRSNTQRKSTQESAADAKKAVRTAGTVAVA